jgi:ribosomal protein S18 acetylase RimI-like enzyme
MTEYRIAAPADVPAIRALIESGYRGDSARRGWTHEADLLEGNRTSEAEIGGIIAAPDKRMLLAEREGALIGAVTISNLGGGRAYMGMLCVDPGVQAAGLGRALIQGGEDLAVQDFAAHTIEGMVIDARAEFIAYYERRGFVRTGEIRPFPLPIDVPYLMVVLERPIG